MDGWVELDLDSFNLRRELTAETLGVEVELSVTPYDVPAAVRLRPGAAGRALIEFRYVDDERVVRRRFNSRVILRTGANSGRVLGVELDLGKASTTDAGASGEGGRAVLTAAIEGIESKVLGPRHNHEMTARVLRLKASDLLARS